MIWLVCMVSADLLRFVIHLRCDFALRMQFKNKKNPQTFMLSRSSSRKKKILRQTSVLSVPLVSSMSCSPPRCRHL